MDEFRTIVKPANSTQETRWLFLVVVLVFFCCASFITFRTGDNQVKDIENWQLNAFEDLNGNELAIFSALQTAAIEISDLHEFEGPGWASVEKLEEIYVPPFVRDSAWRKQGEIDWTMKDLQVGELHIAIYQGRPAKEAIGGTFLLLMLHDHKKKQGNAAAGKTHAPYEIWFNTNLDKKSPDVITDQALISSGWREVVALTGEDELIRTKGKKI